MLVSSNVCQERCIILFFGHSRVNDSIINPSNQWKEYVSISSQPWFL